MVMKTIVEAVDFLLGHAEKTATGDSALAATTHRENLAKVKEWLSREEPPPPPPVHEPGPDAAPDAPAGSGVQESLRGRSYPERGRETGPDREGQAGPADN
jgi:hypothetical protein